MGLSHSALAPRPFRETKGLLRKLPTVSETQRDSWGSYLLPSVLSKTSCEITGTVLPERSSSSCDLPSSPRSLGHVSGSHTDPTWAEGAWGRKTLWGEEGPIWEVFHQT